jgi:hypothetical protein
LASETGSVGRGGEAVSETCSICKQPIRKIVLHITVNDHTGKQIDAYHDHARDCVAAAVRRCAEIAHDVVETGKPELIQMVEQEIRREFPEAFKK